MHTQHEILGDIIKYAREESDYTVEELADQIGISERYLYKIENEGKKPSYNVLRKLIRILSIDANSIFFPEIPSPNPEIEKLLRILSKCDERYLNLIRNTAKTLIEDNAKNQKL